ncbi:hypothetical protein GQ55_2G070300 [Panicum hallii var. hallii]|uniref:Uncharacterized protein n=1 Tax=Panicum hallii var. hallii TaxID=1504633 RepID=A0A2T7EMC9_9POAL|nr:hypothetical protein GQ55_2G070300 [Panicum hallii var. hallii]
MQGPMAMAMPLPLQMTAMAKELTRRRTAPAGTAGAATGATAMATTAAATVTGGARGARRPPPTLGSFLLGRRLPAQGQRRGRGSRRPPASCSLEPPLAGWFGLSLECETSTSSRRRLLYSNFSDRVKIFKFIVSYDG